MTDSFYRSMSKKIDMDFPRRELGDAPGSLGPRAAPRREEESYWRPFGNERLNSRVGTGLPRGPWRVAWRTAVADYLAPRFVLHAGNRVAIQGTDHWQLFDLAGGRALNGPEKLESDLVLDVPSRTVFFMRAHGYLATHTWDGELRHLAAALLSDGFRHRLITRGEDQYTIFSVNPGAPAGNDPAMWSVESIRLGDETHVDQDKVLLGQQEAGMLIQRSYRLLTPALDEDGAVLATDDRIYFMDPGLRITGALIGDFRPLALSLDEAGRIYLVAEDARGVWLWVLARTGERLVARRLESAELGGAIPPLVGYNHWVYLVGRGGVRALNDQGQQAWEYVASLVAGATVTGDDELLATAGSEVLAFDREGKRRVLFGFADETVSTAPVLTPDRKIVVATRGNLYCLEASTAPAE